jgi:hypothetical protein
MNLFADLFCSKTGQFSRAVHSNELFCFGFNAKSIVVLEKISLYFHESAFFCEIRIQK